MMPTLPMPAPVLAQLDKVDPTFSQNWLMMLGVALAFVLVTLNIWDRVRAKKAGETVIAPNPLRMEKVEQLATKVELRAVESAIEKDIHELREAMADERKTARETLGKVHSRIDDVVKHSAEMSGELRQISSQLNRLLEIATQRK